MEERCLEPALVVVKQGVHQSGAIPEAPVDGAHADTRLLSHPVHAQGVDPTTAQVIETELPVGQAHDAFDDDGSLLDVGLQVALADLVEELHRAAAAPARQSL